MHLHRYEVVCIEKTIRPLGSAAIFSTAGAAAAAAREKGKCLVRARRVERRLSMAL